MIRDTTNQARSSRQEIPRVFGALLLLGLMSGAFTAAAAQSELIKGRQASGALSTSDPKLDDDSHYDLWSYRGRAGETIRVTLRSTDFDAYLAVGRMEGGDFSSEKTNDDGGGGTDARVTLTLEEDGVYHVRVNSLGGGEKGAYTLMLEDGPAETIAVSQGRLGLGTAVSGRLEAGDATLDDDSFYDLWTYRGQAGETIRVTLRSSDFDAYLSVGELDGEVYSELDTDDDDGGGTDASLTVTLRETGDIAVRANSLSDGESGAYTLLVETGDPADVSSEDEADEEPEEAETDPLPEPAMIQAGQTLSGELSDSDSRMGDNSRYDLYSFSARRGQQVTVTMRSTAFDSYLAVGRVDGGAFSTLESDDDSGGGDDAQVVYRIPRDGQYAIRANSLFASVTGPYTIRLERGEAPPVAAPTIGAIRYGQTVNGELATSDPQLDDETYYDLWKFTARAGETVVVTMKSSAFDTYLVLGRMEGDEVSVIESNDDGGGGTDSRIEYRLETAGDYVIRANSIFKGLGAYSLQLTRNR